MAAYATDSDAFSLTRRGQFVQCGEKWRKCLPDQSELTNTRTLRDSHPPEPVMLALLKCVAEAVAAKGVRGLTDCVPGGPYLYDVAADALKRLKQRCQHEELREEIRLAALASFQEAQAVAQRVVDEVGPNARPEEKVSLELYLAQVPRSIQRSFRRVEDPAGRTVPAAFQLKSVDDVLAMLPPHLAQFRPGDEVPGRRGWILVELLGTGGFGEVWKVENSENGKIYAVKFCTDTDAKHRLLKHEKDLVRRVQRASAHQHIVQLADSFLDQSINTPWLAYDYVEGGDLTPLILSWQSYPMNDRVKRAVAATLVLSTTVGHCHTLDVPVIHRDLKPANILVHRNGQNQIRLMITDFGIGDLGARYHLTGSRDGRTAYTRVASKLAGAFTPLYASWQQERGDPADPRDDVHALGVITYQMLTGRLDQKPGVGFDEELKHDAVPNDVISLIADCVNMNPARRPENGTALARRTAKVLSELRSAQTPSATKFVGPDEFRFVEPLWSAVTIDPPPPTAVPPSARDQSALEPPRPPFVVVEPTVASRELGGQVQPLRSHRKKRIEVAVDEAAAMGTTTATWAGLRDFDSAHRALMCYASGFTLLALALVSLSRIDFSGDGYGAVGSVRLAGSTHLNLL